MITIAAITVQVPDGNGDGGLVDSLKPAAEIPPEALMSLCDGKNYTIYMPGDTLPSIPVSPIAPSS